MKLEIIRTEDGSQSIINHDLKEGYHSRFGAINESEHVYIHCGLTTATSVFKSINLLEVGLGTGLNALLSFKFAKENNTQINYTALEPFPIPDVIAKKLDYSQLDNFPESIESLKQIHQCEWQKEIEFSSDFSLRKIKEKIEEVKLQQNHYHVVYFDAFAPQIQPELWTKEIFVKIYKAIKEDGILTTYSAKGSVRRNLQSAGFIVERLEGPIGKREILRATKK